MKTNSCVWCRLCVWSVARTNLDNSGSFWTILDATGRKARKDRSATAPSHGGSKTPTTSNSPLGWEPSSDLQTFVAPFPLVLFPSFFFFIIQQQSQTNHDLPYKQTSFDGRIYTVRVYCDQSYPSRAPSVHFISKVNLPFVNRVNGEVTPSFFSSWATSKKSFEWLLTTIRNEMSAPANRKLPQPPEGASYWLPHSTSSLPSGQPTSSKVLRTLKTNLQVLSFYLTAAGFNGKEVLLQHSGIALLISSLSRPTPYFFIYIHIELLIVAPSYSWTFPQLLHLDSWLLLVQEIEGTTESSNKQLNTFQGLLAYHLDSPAEIVLLEFKKDGSNMLVPFPTTLRVVWRKSCKRFKSVKAMMWWYCETAKYAMKLMAMQMWWSWWKMKNSVALSNSHPYNITPLHIPSGDVLEPSFPPLTSNNTLHPLNIFSCLIFLWLSLSSHSSFCLQCLPTIIPLSYSLTKMSHTLKSKKNSLLSSFPSSLCFPFWMSVSFKKTIPGGLSRL